MKLKEITEQIYIHLKRLEADKKVNKRNKHGLLPYYSPYARSGGRFVYIKYISYQHESRLTKAEAELYLKFLDEGGTEQHYAQAYRDWWVKNSE